MTLLDAIEEIEAETTPEPWGCYDAWGETEKSIHVARIGPSYGGGIMCYAGDMEGKPEDFQWIVRARARERKLCAALRILAEHIGDQTTQARVDAALAALEAARAALEGEVR